MEMINVKVNGDFDILMPDHRAQRKEWHSKEGWEKARLRSMHEHIKIGDIVYYLGAELGEMPALCSLWGARVVLFEPNYKSWPVIKAIWDANKLKKPLRCFAGFASDKTQLIPPNPDKVLFGGLGWTLRDDGWPRYVEGNIELEHGFNHLFQEADGHPQVKLDDFVEANGIIPTAIIMDVEGSEWRVLRGAVNIIKKYHPKLWLSIHPDFMNDLYDEDSDQLRQWIKDLGYTETVLDFRHELHVMYE